ncbi:MAG: molecular chaperone DnaJ [Enterobacterales bacterium]
MAKTDYYQTLGVSRTAGEREIKHAYKRLAIKFHPDRNQGNEEKEAKFKEIKEAYEILIDPKKRSTYDQYGHSAFQYGHNSQANKTDFSDIFGDVFGDIFGNQHGGKSNRGSDLQYNLNLTLEESVFGIRKEINIATLTKCNICNGSGTKPGTNVQNCRTCNGYGQLQMRQGIFTVQQTCHVCQGKGKLIKTPCLKCYGNTRIKKSKKLSIQIPSGVNTGDKIRLSGEGEAGEYGNSNGDLYVKIYVKKHHIFSREENNLFCEIPINFSIAALGGNIEVPTLHGKVKLKIPPETQTNRIFRLKNKGVKSVRNQNKGDLLCKIIVETPSNLNEKQKKLFENLSKSFSDRNKEYNNPKETNFFNGVKKFFDNLTHN